MRSTGTSEHHQNNSLKVVIAFAKFLGSDTTFMISEERTDHAVFRYKGKTIRAGIGTGQPVGTGGPRYLRP